MVEILRGWHPDPFGVHELRYFTFDGNPTRLVRDGDAWTHHAPSAALVSMIQRRHTTRVLESPSVAPQLDVRSFPSAQKIVPRALGIQGSPLDTHGIHGERYRTRGEPSRLVRDHKIAFCEEPPNELQSLHEFHIAPPSAAPQMSALEGPPLPSVAATTAASSSRTTFARLVRYGSVSVFSTVTGLTMLGVMVGVLGWSATWSNVITTAIGIIPAFELNRRWVWAHDGKRSLLRQAVPYAAMSFAGLVASTIAVHLAADATSTSTRLVHTAAVEMANIGAYGVLWIVQFALCDRILFRPRTRVAEVADWHGPSDNDVAGGDIDGLPRALASLEVVA